MSVRGRAGRWDAVALLGLLGMGALLVVSWPRLPPVMAIHFGLHGEPNGYGSRAWLFLPMGFAVVLWAGMRVLRGVPRLFNLPAAPGSAQRAAQERLAMQMVAMLGAVLVWVAVALEGLAVAVAHGHLSPWAMALLPAVLVATLLPVVWFFVRVRGLSREGLE